MRDAETVLGIIQNRSVRGLVLEDVYRQLYNPGLYLDCNRFIRPACREVVGKNRFSRTNGKCVLLRCAAARD